MPIIAQHVFAHVYLYIYEKFVFWASHASENLMMVKKRLRDSARQGGKFRLPSEGKTCMQPACQF